MPSPVGHLLAGAAVYFGGTADREARLLLAASLVASVAPDLDFLPGILIGDMRAFHHGMSHSLGFAVLFGIATFLILRRVNSGAALRGGTLAVFAYTSHVLLDLISVHGGSRGVPLFWPLSSAELAWVSGLFGHFRYGDVSPAGLAVMLRTNVDPLMREVGILGAVVVTMVIVRTVQMRRAPSCRPVSGQPQLPGLDVSRLRK